MLRVRDVPRELDHRAIVAETLKPPPKKLGVTHWSTRLLANRLKISHKSVARAWSAYGVKPWKAESFRFSTDPELVGKVTDICGLYLAPPENAIVLCVDEKSQIQALDRTGSRSCRCNRARSSAGRTTTTGMAPPRCSQRSTSRPGRSPRRSSRAIVIKSSWRSSSRSSGPTATSATPTGSRSSCTW
jgi:hypothetical protein